MYTKLKKINEGFTIVETLIVLAIAALIITIVLIAVPDLQRSSRNTDVLHDAQNVASAIQSYEGNNEGALPGLPTTNPTKGPTITIGSSSASTATSTAAVQASTYVAFESASTKQVTFVTNPTTGDSVGVGYIVVDIGAQCSSAGAQDASGSSLTPVADARGVAVYYPIENSSGGNVSCIQE